jgi:hypothetical protein
MWAVEIAQSVQRRAAGSTAGVLFPAEATDLSLPHKVHPAYCLMHRGGSFPGVKRPGCDTNHPLPSRAENKNGGATPSLPLTNLKNWHNIIMNSFSHVCSHQDVQSVRLQRPWGAWIPFMAQVTPLLHTSSWYSADITKHKDNLPFLPLTCMWKTVYRLCPRTGSWGEYLDLHETRSTGNCTARSFASSASHYILGSNEGEWDWQDM